MNEDRFGLHIEDVVLGEIVLRHESHVNVLDRRLPTAVKRQLDRLVLLSRYLRRGGAELIC